MIFNPNVMAAAGGGGGVIAGTYTGNGTSQKNLNLGFEPMAIFIISSPDSGGSVFRFFAINGAPYGLGGTSNNTKVLVSFNEEGILIGESNDVNYGIFNQNRVVYHYIAFPKT